MDLYVIKSFGFSFILIAQKVPVGFKRIVKKEAAMKSCVQIADSPREA